MPSQRPVRTRSYRALLHLLVAGVEAIDIWTQVDTPSLHASALVCQEGGAAGSMRAGRLRGARGTGVVLRRCGGHAPPEGGG